MSSLLSMLARTRVLIGEASTVLRDGQQLQVLVRRGKWPPDMYRKGTTATVVKGGKVGEKITVKMRGDVMSGGQTFELQADKGGAFRLIGNQMFKRNLKVKVVSESVDEAKKPPTIRVELKVNNGRTIGDKLSGLIYDSDAKWEKKPPNSGVGRAVFTLPAKFEKHVRSYADESDYVQSFSIKKVTSESIEEGDTKKLAKAVYRKFPPDSKMKRGGKMKVMLTGNTAKVLGKKDHASVYLDDLDYADLKKLAALWKIKTEDLDEAGKGWGTFKPQPRKPREKIDTEAEVKMALPIVTKYVDAVRALTDFGEYNKPIDRIRRIVKHMQGSYDRSDINLLHQAVSDLDFQIWKRHKKSISQKIPKHHMKSIEYHLGRAWNPGNPKESTDMKPALARLSEAVVKKAAVPMDAEGFIADVKKQARVKDRQLTLDYGALGGRSMVFVNLINLPGRLGGAGGGAEAANNRFAVSVEGFTKEGGAPIRGKVKMRPLVGYGFPTLRGKSGTPQQVAKAIAAHLTKIVKEVEPRYTHTKREELDESMQIKKWYKLELSSGSIYYFYAADVLKSGGIVGMQVETDYGKARGKAAKSTVSKIDMRSWKPVDEKDVPPRVKQKVAARIGDVSFAPKPVVSKPNPTLKPTGPLTDKERKALKVILGYKAFAREKYMQREAPGVEYHHGDPTLRGLEARGILKISKTGSIQAIRAKAKAAMGESLDEAVKGAKEALFQLYKWAVGSNRTGNPYGFPAVRGAIRALGDPEGYDIPEKKPRGKIAGALYDLAKWATGSNKTGNPYGHAPVKAANKALGGDGFELPAKLEKRLSEGTDMEEAAKPVGKVQIAVLAYVKKHGSKDEPIEITKLNRMPELRGVNFGKVQSAVGVLIKKGLLKLATGPESGKQTAVKENDTMKGEGCGSKLHKLAGKSKKEKKSEEVDFTTTNVSLDRIRVDLDEKVGALDEKKKSMKPGGGGRFAALKKKLKGKVKDPGAVAAAIGRKKYGAKKFAAMAAKGRARAAGG